MAGFMNERLAPFRAKRQELSANPQFVEQILKDGSSRASLISDSVMAEVREALKI
jgi:tryptophanyl-tRNA synthetase